MLMARVALLRMLMQNVEDESQPVRYANKTRETVGYAK